MQQNLPPAIAVVNVQKEDEEGEKDSEIESECVKPMLIENLGQYVFRLTVFPNSNSSTWVLRRNSNSKKVKRISKKKKTEVAEKIRSGEYELDEHPCSDRTDKSDIWTHYKRVYHKQKEGDKGAKCLVIVRNGGATETSFISCRYCHTIGNFVFVRALFNQICQGMVLNDQKIVEIKVDIFKINFKKEKLEFRTLICELRSQK